MIGPALLKTLPLFARFVAKTMGLHFSSERLLELQHKMTSLARQAAYPDLDKYLLHLMSSPLSGAQLDTLARTLTIGETYFLRDPRSYQVLEEELLPALIDSRRSTDRTLRIWSAGCSSGEEPYTIAILLYRAIADLSKWKISILASDINPLALERARLGVYSRWSFRNAPDWLMGYFNKLPDGRFEIVPRIRKMVRFSQLNLAGEQFPTDSGSSELDIIFCRNVMLYFDQALIEKTMTSFHAALKETGWLFVGPTEVDQQMYRGFSCRHYDGAFVLGKGGPQKQAPYGSLPILLPQHSASSGTENGAASAARAPAASLARPSAVPASSQVQASPLPEISRANEPPKPAGHAEALALYEKGLYQQAAAHALGSLQPEQEQAGLLGLAARAFANIGSLDEARDCCQRALDCDRLNCHLHYLLSIILEQQGDTAGAARSLKHALFIDHDYLLAYFALGNLHRQRGEPAEAERNFANALHLLERRDPHEVLPEAEGMTAGRLAEIIRAMTGATDEHPGQTGAAIRR